MRMALLCALGLVACGESRSTAELPSQVEARMVRAGPVRRVRLRAGRGRSGELWSFVPPDGDAAGWARDMRAVTRQATTSDRPTPR